MVNVITKEFGIDKLSDKDLTSLYYELRDLVDNFEFRGSLAFQFYYLKYRSVCVEMDYRSL